MLLPMLRRTKVYYRIMKVHLRGYAECHVSVAACDFLRSGHLPADQAEHRKGQQNATCAEKSPGTITIKDPGE